MARETFDHIDGGAVNARLTRFAQTPVTYVSAVPAQQRVQTSRPAVYRRRLHHLGNEQLTIAHWEAACEFPSRTPALSGGAAIGWAKYPPAFRSRNEAGETVSIATSSVPGNPCCSGIRPLVCGASSTRTRPSRTSLPTLRTLAVRAPYSSQGTPSSRSQAVWPGRTRPIAARGSKYATIRI